MEKSRTLPGLLFEHDLDRPNDIALRWKRYGIWKCFTWREYAEIVRHVAMGLDKLGIKRGDVVTFMCRNRPEWVCFEIGAMAMGILPFGIFSDIEDREMIYHFLNLSDSKVVLAEDQEQADKILDLREKLPGIEHIVVPEFQEVAHYHDPVFMSFDDLLDMGKAHFRENPNKVDLCVTALNPDGPAVLSTTSGTTGLPKMAVLSNWNLLSMAKSINEADPVGNDQNYASTLTTAWVGERMMSISWALVAGFITNFPESPDTMMRDLREVAPVVLFAPPRTWEGIQAQIEISINDTSFIKQRIYNWFMPQAIKIEEMKLHKKQVSVKHRVAKWFADTLILRKLRDYFGLSKVLYAYTGGAALGTDVVLFFRAVGINVKQLYGQSETSGIAFVHRNGDVKLETVGKPLSGIHVDITENGEIRVKGDPVFQGYYNNEKATLEVLKDGYLHTGDYGYVDDDDHLVVVDRLTHMAKLKDGTVFSPQYIETKMKFSSYIREAVALGNGKPYVVVLIQIDMQVVGHWAERRSIPYTTFGDLAGKADVYKLIEGEFNRVNESIQKGMRPKKFALLKKELDPEMGDITYTQKIRRGNVLKRNEALFNSLY